MTSGIGADHLAEREEERAHAVDAVREALGAVEQEGREPDLWERVYFAEAISSIFRGLYRSGAVCARLALTPEAERSPTARLPTDPVFHRFDISTLREALEEAERQPVEPFGHFGTVLLRRPTAAPAGS